MMASVLASEFSGPYSSLMVLDMHLPIIYNKQIYLENCLYECHIREPILALFLTRVSSLPS